jgi:Domain of unknown function (DUF3883)
VLNFERDSGRTPKEMDHGFPGYDIEAKGPDGNVERYIEVKSLAGHWDGWGVGVTRRQMDEARKRRDSYCLYVVERAGRDDFNINRIQDPAGKVDEFRFDDAWITISDASVAGRPDTDDPAGSSS